MWVCGRKGNCRNETKPVFFLLILCDDKVTLATPTNANQHITINYTIADRFLFFFFASFFCSAHRRHVRPVRAGHSYEVRVPRRCLRPELQRPQRRGGLQTARLREGLLSEGRAHAGPLAALRAQWPPLSGQRDGHRPVPEGSLRHRLYRLQRGHLAPRSLHEDSRWVDIVDLPRSVCLFVWLCLVLSLSLIHI